MEEHIIPHYFEINKTRRSINLKQNAKLIWFTGLSGSGKSTIANQVEKELVKKKFKTYLLDGDNVRNGLCKDLSFSLNDRTENIRRIAEVSNLMLDAGLIVCASFVSPLLQDRENVKKIIGQNNFIEIYVSTPLEICEQRDVKGLYSKARKGQISNFTGISSPYEEPVNPDLKIDTSQTSLKTASSLILNHILPKLIYK